MQLDMTRTRRKHKFVTRRLRSASNCDLLHVNRRLSFRHRQAWKIQHGQSLRGRDPELAVTRKSRVGLADAGLCRRQAVGTTERCIVDRFILSIRSLETARRDSKNAGSVEPQFPLLRFHHVARFNIRSDVNRPVVFDAEDSSGWITLTHSQIEAAGSILPNW